MKRSCTFFLQRLLATMVILLVAVPGNKVFASISVTTGTGGTNICTNKAADGSAPAYTTLGNITITEGTNKDLANSSGSWTVTATLAAPAGWELNTSIAPTYSFSSGNDISSVTGAFSSGKLVVTISGSGKSNIDAFSIIGLRVRATTAASNGSFSASGYIYAESQTGTITGLTTGSAGTNFADLSQSLAAITGLAGVCASATTSLSDATSGGTWLSSNTAAATVSSSGVVTGAAAGTTNISYTVGGCATWRTVTASAIPSISNNNALCSNGSSNTLVGTPSGGTWLSTATSVATINSSTGSMTPAASGTTTISYTASGCVSTVIGTVNSLPSANSVTGGGAYCSGGTGVNIGLGGSQSGVQYQLYIGASPTGSALDGTGSSISFGSQTAAGTYTVMATNATTGCTRSMTGSATVSINSTPTLFSVTGGGGYCTGGTGVTVGLGGSQSGVNYQLYIGSSTNGSPVSGTGSSLSFGLKTSAGTYTVLATNTSNSCTNGMTGNAIVSVYSNPSTFSVTGGGAYCSGGTGVSVGLGGSQTGVNYQLYNGSSAVGSTVAGTGSALSLGLQTSAGTYTVRATNASFACSTNMTGSTAVNVNPNPSIFTVNGGGAFCSGGAGVDVGLGGSQTGVNYQLYNGSSAVGSPVAGTGSALNFGSFTSAGSYSVAAVNGSTSCNADMTGNVSVSINSNPTAFVVTGGGSYCAGGSGVSVGLGGSQAGVNYQLYNGSSAVGSPVAGTGSALDFGLKTSAGSYSVAAANASTSCAADMTGNVSVSINSNPTAFVVTGGGAYCAGGSGVDVGLGGSQAGVNYQLYNGSSSVGSPVAGTGSALNFGSFTSAGSYSVGAANASTSCAADMTGNVSVSINSNPTAFVVTGGGSYCAGGSGVGIGLGGSQAGVNYQLYNGSSVVGSPVTGTGSALNFGSYTSAGSYSVAAANASTSCAADMTGNASVSINSNPTAFVVTGGGSYCAGGSGVGIGLGGSQAGVNYQLYNGSSAVGTPVAGTGSALDFGLKTSAGSYSVAAANASTSCAADMTGNVSVSINSNPTAFVVAGGGSYCAGGTGVDVGLGGSQTGVNYQLYNGSSAIGSPVAGTGSALDFGLKTSAGSYSVAAANASTSCAADMTGNVSVSINSNPTAFVVTGGGSYCAGGSGVDVGLGGSQTGVNYQLYNGSSAVGSPVAGTGSALNFGSFTSAGSYSIAAANASTSCAADMTGNVSVSINSNPTAFVVTGGGSYCAGGSGVSVGLGGSQAGVNYQLYNGSSAVGSPVAGTGSALDFGSHTSAGSYSVAAANASTSCAADMTGNVSVSINFNPTAFLVTGGGAYCAGGSGVDVGLGGSQTGVNYQLYNGSSSVGSPVAGTGSALNFGSYTSAGSYSISAVNISTSCAANMTGSVTISVSSNPTAYFVTGGGSYCAGGTGVDVGLGSSQTGVNYQLYNGSSAVGSPVAGTGSALSFGSFTSAGSYSVAAANASTSCAADMTGNVSVSINSNPTAFLVIGGGSYCAGGTGMTVGLGGSQAGINYQLYNGSSAVGSPLSGTGSALNFGLQISSGSYNVTAINTSTSCAGNMTGSVTISVNSNPTAFVVTGGGSYCAGGSGVGVGLGGSQTGVNYQLYNGSSAVGSPVAGTGSALDFGLKTSAGSYSVAAANASTSCAADMTGNVSVSINSNPTAFLVTGGGSYCAGGAGVDVGLGGSQAGISYQLYRGSSAVGSPVSGTGSALDFGLHTSAGSYSVSAADAGTSCAANMTGNASVSINSNPTAFLVTGGGSYCAGGAGMNVGLGGSQTGVDYQLYNGSLAVGSPVAGTGSALNFGLQTSVGSYNVSAINSGTSCVGNMTGSVTISVNTNPTAFLVSGGGSYCAGGAGVQVGLDGSQTGVNYQLYNGSSAVGSAVAGTGSALNFGLKTSSGSYSVSAVNAGTSCTADMTGNVSVSINSNPTAFLVTGGGSYCAGGPGVDVGLGGSQTGVNYQLYNGSSAVGSPVAGTGSALSFGLQTSAGSYSVNAVNGSTSCAANMTGNTSVSVNSIPDAGIITGEANICQGTMTALGNLVTGGLWSSSAIAIATIGSDGIVNGISAGTAIITYVVMNDCGSAAATKIVTVNPAPNAGTITGTASVCQGNTTALSNSVSGGEWSSAAAGIATVNSSGVVSGVAAGMATISYAVTNGCGTTSVTKVVTVNAAPNAGTIAGPSAVIVGLTMSLSNAASGGAWSSGATGIASVSSVGIVTGVTLGTAVISYVVTNGCGTAVSTKVVSVNPVGTPSVSGSSTVCVGSTTTQSASVAGGTWSSSNTTKATVSAAGVVTGVAAGTAIISYSISGIVTTVTVTVNATPALITGSAFACPGTTTSLSNATTGGTWNTGDPAIATVDAATGVVTGVVGGTTTIAYTIGGGCSRTATLTINAKPTISGSLGVCVGKSTVLTSSPVATTWLSSNTAVAPVGSGSIAGMTTGTAEITATTAAGCKTSVNVTVSALPPAISGTLATCVGSTTTLGNAMTGGTWASYAPSFASINSSGVVTGLVVSNVMITYTSANGCVRTGALTVNAAPAITGTSTLCVGTSGTLSSGGTGTWSSSNVSSITVGSTGVITGVSAGNATISYTSAIGCKATAVAVVNTTPTAIGGPTSVCAGGTFTLTNSVGGGAWSSNSTYVTIGTSGNVTGTSAATATISYTIGSCRATRIVTILANPAPFNIVGAASICIGATTSVASAWPGTWSSSSPTITTVSSTGIVTGGAAGNGTIVFTGTNGCQTSRVVTVNVCSSRQAITGVGATELHTQIVLFPNPTNGMVTFQAPEAGTLSVLAVDGKEVASYQIKEGDTNIDLPNDLAAGVYMCRFNGNEGSSAIVRLIYQP